MSRTKDQREDDHTQILAALTETPVTDPRGRGLRFDQVIEAITGQPWNRSPNAEVSRIRRDLHALRRRGLVVEPYLAGSLWSYWRLAVPEDEDAREDAADVARMRSQWEPAP